MTARKRLDAHAPSLAVRDADFHEREAMEARRRRERELRSEQRREGGRSQ